MAAKEKDNEKVKVKAPVEGEEKQKALDTALSQIEKQFGKGAVVRLAHQQRVDIHPQGLGVDRVQGVLHINEHRVASQLTTVRLSGQPVPEGLRFHPASAIMVARKNKCPRRGQRT